MSNDRVAIVAGLANPVHQAGTALRSMRTVDLAIAVVKELIERASSRPREITLCVYGQVVPTLDWLEHRARGRARLGAARRTSTRSASRAPARPPSRR